MTVMKTIAIALVAGASISGSIQGSVAGLKADPTLNESVSIPTVFEERVRDAMDDPNVQLALREPDSAELIESTLADMAAAGEGAEVGWDWVPYSDIDWAGPADDSAPSSAPARSEFTELSDEQAEGIETILTAVAPVNAAARRIQSCGNNSWYRILTTIQHDDNVYAKCYRNPQTTSINVYATGYVNFYGANGAAAVCPGTNTGRVYWTRGSYTWRWSTYRGPVSSSSTCYHFPAVGTIQMSTVNIKCNSTPCPV